MTAQRAMMFIDAQNLFQAQLDQYGEPAIDFGAFKTVLCSDYDLIRPYYFDSHPPGEYRRNFYYSLQMQGYRIENHELSERDGKQIEKGVDISIATELIAQGFNDSYDVAILVTGDEDYKRAVRYVQNQGKRVIAAQFDDYMAGELKKVVDEYIQLDSVKSKIRE